MQQNGNQPFVQNPVQPVEVTPQGAMAPSPARQYSTTEIVFAWLSVFLGYLFCRSFPVIAKPFYGLLFVIALYLITVIVMAVKRAKPGLGAIMIALSGVASALSLFIASNSFIHFFAFSYSFAAYCYFVYATFKNQLEKGYSSLLLADFIKALFIMPFCSLGSMFSSILSRRKYRFGNNLAKVILGAIIACIPTILVLILLSYDRDFTALMGKIFAFTPFDLLVHVIAAVFGIPVGMYIFSLFISSSDNKAKTVITAEQCRKAYKVMGFVHPLTALAATLPIVFVYLIFFISQWKYYVSAFAGVLPNDTNFAGYAREGFFQLCAVSVINLLIIIALNLFIRKNDSGNSVTLRVMSVIYSFCTLVLMSTAMSKLVLYIGRYGLTPKRVYAFWFMLVLALIFITVLLKQVITKIKVIPTTAIITVIMFLALGLSGTDTIIAKYNVDRYLDGTLKNVNVYMSKSLGDSAIPELTRLYTELSKKSDLSPEQEALLDNLEIELEIITSKAPDDLSELTLPGINADIALKQSNIGSYDN